MVFLSAVEEVLVVVCCYHFPGVLDAVPSSLDEGEFLLAGHVWSLHGLQSV